MSDNPEPAPPGSAELEALVNRAVAERIHPLLAQVTTVQRALAILVDRFPETRHEVAPAASAAIATESSAASSHLIERFEGLADRLERSLAPLPGVADQLEVVPQAVAGALESSRTSDAEAKRWEADDLRKAVTAAVDDAVERVQAAALADGSRLVDRLAALESRLADAGDERRKAQTDELRQALAGPLVQVTEALAEEARSRQAQTDDLRTAITDTVEEALVRLDAARAADSASVGRALVQVEAARRADASRLLEEVATFAQVLSREAEARNAHADELRTAVAGAVAETIAATGAARAVETDRLLEQVGDMVKGESEARRAQTDELRAAVTGTVEQVVAQVDGIRLASSEAVERAVAEAELVRKIDAGRLLGQVAILAEALTGDADVRRAQADELRSAIASVVEKGIAAAEAARTNDAAALLDQVASLRSPLAEEAAYRHAQLDDVLQAVAAKLDQVVGQIEAAQGADGAAVLEELTALGERMAADAQRRDDQATALLTSVDERLQSLHAAVGKDAEGRTERLAARLEAVADEQRQAVTASLLAATAEHSQAVVARLDERTAAIADLEDVAPRVAAEIQELGLAALNRRAEPLVERLVEACDTLAHEVGRIEALARGHAGEARAVEARVAALFTDVAERAESAVDRSRARIAEGQVALGLRFDGVVAELLHGITAVTDRLEARLAESTDGLRATSSHQNGALLDAITKGGQQLVEGLAEIKAALDSTAGGGSSSRVELTEALEGVRAAVDALRNDSRLDALVVEQAAARDAQLDAIQAVAARIDEMGPVVAHALLAEVERAARSASAAEEAVAGLHPDALRAAVGEAAEEAAGEVRAAARRLEETMSVLALEDLRSSHAVLRQAVQEGSHKAELAALDIRGLRDRLTPHLEALSDATTRRAEADQAGFDAVLARLDKLLATPPG